MPVINWHIDINNWDSTVISIEVIVTTDLTVIGSNSRVTLSNSTVSNEWFAVTCKSSAVIITDSAISTKRNCI